MELVWCDLHNTVNVKRNTFHGRAICMYRRVICLEVFMCSAHSEKQGCVKMFPPKTKADVGMVQCVSEGHGKPPGRKTVGTRRRTGPCKERD